MGERILGAHRLTVECLRRQVITHNSQTTAKMLPFLSLLMPIGYRHMQTS
jgi:hypothetical protein